MTIVYLYVVAASPNPDRVECTIPFRVDDELIFFGPCKKRIREALRASYLQRDSDHADVSDDVYLVGVNGRNAERVRKIVWVGHLRQVSTFARAHENLVGSRFRAMRDRDFSPLHVIPLMRAGRLIGYEHRGREHAERDNWILDLVTTRRSPAVRRAGRRLLLQPGFSAWDAFPRDVCLLLDNLFFARGTGLAPDGHLLDILQRAQPGKQVSPYALFGVQPDGSADGLRGRYLRLEGRVAEQAVAWIHRHVRPLVSGQPWPSVTPVPPRSSTRGRARCS